MIIFSTNLEPTDLADEAFLRRIPYKIEVKDPSVTEFARLFEAECRAHSAAASFPRPCITWLRTHYAPHGRPLRRCHPRDLLSQIKNYCVYYGRPMELRPDYFDRVVKSYFTAVHRGRGDCGNVPASAAAKPATAAPTYPAELGLSAVTNDIDVNIEPLPGYRLIEHIGAGGYGEVWRAEAPGGLTKAIKFVFGQHHEKRASNELRALDRVRGVRHPFLLSLERIEVVDGRLARGHGAGRRQRERSLRRLPPGRAYAAFRATSCWDILRDAADALDFMGDTHALQHLDIKPENLLLLAGHVKVADFGLVKDVRQSQASLVGGMTPLYAAPEVFRGTPSPHSDQYSLAIVYQEMLTGTLPFCGGNAAELTLQHLNDEPDLSCTVGCRSLRRVAGVGEGSAASLQQLPRICRRAGQGHEQSDGIYRTGPTGDAV